MKMKKLPKMYTAVFLVALVNLSKLLFGWGWYTYYCGFNLWYLGVSEVGGKCLMYLSHPLYVAVILWGILGFIFPKLRKSYLIYMIAYYVIELACCIGNGYIPSYWAIPVSWLDPILYLLAIAVCATGLWMQGKSFEAPRLTPEDRASLPSEEINVHVERLHDKLNSDR